VEVVNSNGGAAVEKVSACKSGGIARPGGAIPEAQVGGGTTWVLWSWSLRRMWCCGYGRVLRSVMVAVILLCVMLQSWWLALEGEEGHASVSRGGERWESSGTWHTILKKLASTHNISTSGCG